MRIKKAIITAAGRNQRTLPLQTLVGRDSRPKTALAILIEEVLEAEVEEIGLVIQPGDEASYANAAGPHAKRIHFIEQASPMGYGHAVHCGKSFAGSDPFLLLVGDHIYVSFGKRNCAQQLVEIAGAESCAVSAVQATHESKLPYYGVVGGKLIPGRQGLYQIDNVLEKPTPTVAEQQLIVPGLRAGHYLCFFGMHVLTPGVMDHLEELLTASDGNQTVNLSAALAMTAARERYLACELKGRRHDIGAKYGLLMGQLALSLNGQDRDEVLAQLIEMLAQN